ncbi:MAG: helix-turn-helix transcriptional regulator [Bdellovibrionales bacterium]|nr:helix-turn-helix transcriptional regulator [Bdellovibrionales bacterium]
MKKRPIEGPMIELIVRDTGRRFQVPKDKAEGLLVLLDDYRVTDDDDEWVDADEVFKDLDLKYTKLGSILRGARLKEDMTQAELAAKLKITQGDLSKMEHGKRPIGKKMAKRLAAILNVGWQVFIGE